eukprot:3089474-Prymnesium_polylepis.1
MSHHIGLRRDHQVFAAITSAQLHREHLDIATQFATIARDLYIDAEPHEAMVYVQFVRNWDKVHLPDEAARVRAR